jgi:glycosyltransferase involved in cell wall biosynthesis
MRVAVVVKGYPRLSETFIARELLGLQERGLHFTIVSLRHPTDRIMHDLHERITAPVLYLPEYLHQEIRRVMRSLLWAMRAPGFTRALGCWLRDLSRDPSRNRIRRFGQALVLTAELPPGTDWLYAHFLHTPCSVARYSALMRRLPFSVSAHAKDIWTIPDWEKLEKLRAARWAVTCTRANLAHLRGLAPGADIELLYHGVDTERFRPPADRGRAGAGKPAARPVTLISVARCVPKKGLRTLLDALASLPNDLAWRHVHIGGGPMREELMRQANHLGLAQRVSWIGSLPHLDVADLLRTADIMCLPSRIAEDGDRDGMPNVLLEAMSAGLAVVASSVSAIPELIEHERNGLLVPPDDAAALAAAIERLLRDPGLRARFGREARVTVVERFTERVGLDRLAARFGPRASIAQAA